MPEGDTVWRTARRLDLALSGQILTTSDFRVPQWAQVDLAGQRVVETVSRGKHLLTRLDEVTIHTHLKMEGAWHVYAPASRWRSPAFQARIVLANATWTAVGFRLGVVDVLPRDGEDAVVGHLGPDLLGADWSPAEALRRLRTRPEVPVGEALLDQRNLAGIGNMYKCELCFLFGVHPNAPIGDVGTLAQLVDRAHQLLMANRERAEQSTTGNTRRGQSHWVYERVGRPCRRCGTTIRSATFTAHRHQERRLTSGSAPEQDRGRTSFWCPSCQPER